MPIHTEQVDKKYVRIYDTFDKGSREISYGRVMAKTTSDPERVNDLKQDHYLIDMPDGSRTIHPVYACTEITKEEYFLGVLKG